MESKQESRGKVKWFNAAKGYGFIMDNTGQDIFVHFRAITGEGYRSLSAGEEVLFKKEKTAKGMSAIQVKSIIKG